MSKDVHPAPADDGTHLPVPGAANPARRDLVSQRGTPLSTSLVNRNEVDDDEIDLLAYWRILVRHRWLILGVASVVVTVALVRVLLTPPMYRATTTMQIELVGVQAMQVQGVTPYARFDPDFAQTQIQLLQSRSLAQRVAEDMHLAGSDIFERLRPPAWTDRVRRLWAPVAASSSAAAGSDALSPLPPAHAAGTLQPDATAQLSRATSLIQGGLSVEPVRNTHLVRVHYDSTLPAFSARAANAVAAGFIAATMDRAVGASSYASKYLEDQLALLRSRLEDSERDLVAFAQKEQLVPTETGSSLAAQNLGDLNAALATAQAKRIAAQARWEEAKAAKGAALPADMLANSILRTLQTQLAKLQGQYQDQLKTFKPDYPSMQALQGQMTAVQGQIDDELEKIRASVKAEYDAAKTQETMLLAKLDELRHQALAVDSRSIQYNILKRDVDTNRELYNALLQRFKQVSMAGGAKPNNIAVIDPAIVPKGRFSPSLSRNVMLGLMVGLFLGVCMALLREYLDNTLKSPTDIEHHLQLAVLGIIPKLKHGTPETALDDPRSMFSESYRSVRTALQFSTESGTPRSLFITSTAPGEGKSTTATVLAQCFAQLGKRVLIIEADMRHSCLAQRLGLSSQVGLSALLSGATSLAQAIQHTDDERLDVIVAGPTPPNPSELLAGARLVSLLTVCKHRYDQVIIDGPPVLGIADAPILANNAEGTLLVVQSGEARIDATQAAVKRLRSARVRLTGALLTQYDARASGYEYGGGYYAYGAAPQLEHI